jgi:hypothetical protein
VVKVEATAKVTSLAACAGVAASMAAASVETARGRIQDFMGFSFQ